MIAVRGPKAGLLKSGMCVPSVGPGRGRCAAVAARWAMPRLCTRGAKHRRLPRTMPLSLPQRHKLMSRTAFLAVGLVVIFGSAARGQGKEAVLAGYTKYEYRIPMRDGARLFTSVYVPKDDSKPYPILLDRTPYSVGPYGVD